jgi:acyl carrier protein
VNRADLLQRVAQLTPDARQRLAAKLRATISHATDRARASTRGAERTTLVAYYVSTTGRPLPPENLRQFLSTTLPDYLIPALFYHIDSVPRTNHGKVDTAALPDPLPAASSLRNGDDETASAIENELLAIWRTVLGVERLGLRDSFFELGGDSLLGIRLLGMIREKWDIDLSMAALFDHPTVAGAAAQVENILWARGSAQGRTLEGTDGQEEVEF